MAWPTGTVGEASRKSVGALISTLIAAKGQHDAIMMLALEHEKVFERAVSASSFMRRNGGKDWSAFELTNVSPDSFIGDASAKRKFITEALAILEVPPGRKHEADWYEAVRRDPITGEESRVTQATVYVEERPESGLAFGENDSVEMRMVPRVGELGFSYDPKDGVVEICAVGRKTQRDRYAQAFAECFFEQSPVPVEVTRRPINFARLARAHHLKPIPPTESNAMSFPSWPSTQTVVASPDLSGATRASRSISSSIDALATVRRFPRPVGK